MMGQAEIAALQADLARVTRELDSVRAGSDLMSESYLHLRATLNAYDTPYAPTTQQIYAVTEAAAKSLKARAEAAERECEALRKALSDYVQAVAVGGDDTKESVMAAIRAADNRARAALAGSKPHG